MSRIVQPFTLEASASAVVGADIRIIRTTDDCLAADCDVGIICETCRRMAVFDASEFEEHRGPALELFGHRFVCRCGSRTMLLLPVPRAKRPEPLPRRKMPLVPLYVLDAPPKCKEGDNAG